MAEYWVYTLRRDEEHRVQEILDKGGKISPFRNHHGHYVVAHAVVPVEEEAEK